MSEREKEAAIIERLNTIRGQGLIVKLTSEESVTVLDMASRTHELEDLFDRHWAAEMRGIKRWREETGKDLTLPDTADFTFWLLNKAFPPDVENSATQ